MEFRFKLWPTAASLAGLFLVFSVGLFGQLTPPMAGQLTKPIASYDLKVALDPKTHMLHGGETLTWLNDSPDTVPALRFHLYMNAFKNQKSTFMRESGGQFLRGKFQRPFAADRERENQRRAGINPHANHRHDRGVFKAA